MKILVFGFTLDDKRLHKNALTFYYDLRKGLEAEAADLGLSLRMDFSEGLGSRKIKEALGSDAVIAVNPPRLPSLQAKWNLLEKSKPCVSLGSESLFAEGNYVGTDDAAAVESLVAHLVSEGFKKIGFFSAANEGYTHRRFEVYLAALGRHHLTSRQAWVNAFHLGTRRLLPEWAKKIKKRKHGSETELEREGRKMFRQYLKQANLPEAVIFETDRLAKYGFEILTGMGKRVPEDMALTGFDDMQIEMAPQGYNILTTIRQNFYELGRYGVRLAYEILKKKRPPLNQRIYFPGKLVVRQTSLKRSLARDQSTQGSFKKTTTEFIGRRYAEDNLARELADFHLLKPEYFLIRFKKEFGSTFTSYLAEVRMEKAAFLLGNTRRSVTQILHEVGFHNHQAFNRVFKKKYRLSPLAFRKAAAKNPNASKKQ